MLIGGNEVKLEVRPRHRRSDMRSKLNFALSYLLAILMALVIAALIILISGKSPVIAFEAMFSGAFGSLDSFSEVLVRTIPYLLAGLGLTVCYRTGLVSIGAEGQMIMGGLAATVVGIYLGGLPRLILLPLVILAAMIAGGIWSAIAGYFKATRGVSEVIITIMLNYAATYILLYLLDGPLREPPGYYPQSAVLSENAHLSVILTGTRLHSGFVFAVIGAVLVYFLLWKMPLGFQMRAVGFNPVAAKTSGIGVAKNMVLAMFLAGTLTGLAGAVEITGLHHRLINGFSAEMGFDAMAIALLGGLHPVGVTIASFLFAALRVGANMMQRTVQVPASLVNVIQGLIILMILSQRILSQVTIKLFAVKKKTEEREAA